MDSLKHLKPKGEFTNYKRPDYEQLDVFPAPKDVGLVTLRCTEFTSLCPVTGQPDYSGLTIRYRPKDLCLESKSLKLYLAGYRQYGGFTETLAREIAEDLFRVLGTAVNVVVSSSPRGGIAIEAEAEYDGRNTPG